MNIFLFFTLIASLTFTIQTSQAESQVSPFTTDGCSAFIDQPVTGWGKSWAHCCVVHDFSYWHGGTWRDRDLADRALSSCTNKVVGQDDQDPRSFGALMWLGVLIGGAPYTTLGGNPFPWRWGYGWNSDSKYQDLSDIEKETILKQLQKIQMAIPLLSMELDLNDEQIAYIERELYLQIVHFTKRHDIR